MGYFTFLKLRLKGLSIRKPFQAEYPSIYIIVQDFNLAIVLEIKDDSSSCTGWASHDLLLHLCNTYAGYVPIGSGCSPALPFQNILCFPFYVNFKTVAKIIFFIYPTLRCIGGLRYLHSNIYLSNETSLYPNQLFLFTPNYILDDLINNIIKVTSTLVTAILILL